MSDLKMFECGERNKRLIELAKEMKEICRQQDCMACVMNREKECAVNDYSPNMWDLNDTNNE